jgi:alpha-2-macroglobulin
MARHSIRFAFIAVPILLLSLSCAKHKKQHGPVEQGLWEPYISSYTSGVVSRETVVRVRLAVDAVSESAVNKPAQPSPLSLKPAVKGTAVWTDRQTIEFRPEKRLKDNQDYTGVLALGKLIKVPPRCGEFTFEFHTLQQTFEVRIEGLQPVKADELKWQQCGGSIVTADVENGEPVEKVISATQAGRRLPVRWQHADDRLVHGFTVDSVERKDDSSTLEISWNGSGIGVDQSGSQNVHVPAIGEFSILDAQCVPGDQQHILIRFSDPLEPTQDLRGLVLLSTDEGTRFTIEKNEVHVYPGKHLSDAIDITVNPGVRNVAGRRFKETTRLSVTIESVKPDVRFTGKGVIIPSGGNAVVPFEAVNLSAVDVRAYRIFENNIPQFLQVNDLDGDNEMQRVGRVVWRKTVHLNVTADMRDRWVRCGFDASPLLALGPASVYRIELRFRRCQSLYPCDSRDTSRCPDIDRIVSQNADEEREPSNWDYYNPDGDYDGEEYGGETDYQDFWAHRDDPCHPGYFRHHGGGGYRPAAARNFFVSDIGLLAKKGAGDTVLVTATDLTTAQAMGSVDVTICNYQNQAIGAGRTDADGFAAIAVAGSPHLIIAGNGKHAGYLRVDNGNALSVSHFDVGGAAVQQGIKGFLYGERGVWRPGDSLFLTFVLEDKAGRLPKEHPVTFDLVNPRGQTVASITRTASVDRFYNFSTCTAPDAPTGNYIGRVKVGGAVFETTLKVEAIMPNRLKVKLDFGADTLVAGKNALRGTLSARWLTGATAKNLTADAEATLEPVATVFPKYSEYVFDDPVRRYRPESQKIFDGRLNAEGTAVFAADIKPNTEAPGMLRAQFRSRVFEEGGAFSVDRFSLPFSPYKRYVGILVPRGDRSRGMLLTDTAHLVRVAVVSPSGVPAAARRIQIKLYKVDWRWWWEKGDEMLADYIASPEHKALLSDTLRADNGQAVWTFRVKYPEWGRFLIRAVDLESGHAAGKFVYIDWPGWAGRSQKESPGGATVLSFSSDKEEYRVGDKATLTVPSGDNGRILLSLENGSRVLREFWVAAKPKETAITFDVTPEMAPNVYAFATYIQPYSQTVNDLPMRMYGVTPLRVVDPQTKLSPVIDAPEVLVPGEKATVRVSEQFGREMAYTLAVVDEGLLDLTRFETPDLWSHFYQREALGVRTWDLFDLVCGAYGAKLERLLAVGGDEGMGNPGQKRGNRFPPMVRFLGPFHLDRGKTARHEIDVPQYVGSVRIMAVAGENGAYGRADRTAFVRKPLMVLGTLPRVLGPQETVKLPVSVFAMEKNARNVKVSVSVKGHASIAGASEKSLTFTEPGDELVAFDLAVGAESGTVSVAIHAESGGNSADQRIDIEVRNPNRPVTWVVDTVLSAGGAWSRRFTMPGLAGTNNAMLELSRIPPIDLGRRLEFLISYPYGCVEQTTSSVFPQLFLKNVVELPAGRMSEIQKNVQAGIDRLRSFQTSQGGFSYWPGCGEADAWGSSYAGHFLLEAKLAGYALPPGVLDAWLRYQKSSAQSWSASAEQSELIQAYRLYTLSLAQKPEPGAMNRLAEKPNLPAAAKWRLAAAYKLAGQPEAAQRLVMGIPRDVKPYRELAWTYGSDTRDEAMILETLTLLGDDAGAAQLAKLISEELTKEQWMSTQTTAYSLLAVAKFAGKSGTAGKIDVSFSENGGGETGIVTTAAVAQRPLAVGADGTTGSISLINKSGGMVYARVIMKGTPAMGQEKASSEGVSVLVKYLAKSGAALDPADLAQGTDFTAQVTIETQSGRGPFRQMALAQIFPSGWEIRNARFEGVKTEQSQFTYQDVRDDRVYTYFDLGRDESKTFRVEINAAYLGRYYLPMVCAEAMYDASISGVVPGKWVEVGEAGK